jgi:transposase
LIIYNGCLYLPPKGLSKEASMPRPESRFIGKLSKRQMQKLEELKDHGSTPRIRHRAHAVLLSHQGTSVVELAKIFQTNRTTISQWLNRWDAEGLEGLGDKQRPGAPPKLSESEQARVVELLKQSPHNPAGVLAEIKKEMNQEISRSTLKRIAKQAGLVWKRVRKSLGSKRDQKKFATQT